MSLFGGGLSHLPRKERREVIIVGDMDISRLMVYVQQVEEEKLMDREELKNKTVKKGNESEQKKSNTNQSSFQQKLKGPTPYSTCEPILGTKVSTVAGVSKLNLLIIKVTWRNKVESLLTVLSVVGTSGTSREGSTFCFKCGKNGHFMRE